MIRSLPYFFELLSKKKSLKNLKKYGSIKTILRPLRPWNTPVLELLKRFVLPQMVFIFRSLMKLLCSKKCTPYHTITITLFKKSSEIGKIVVIRYHDLSASLRAYLPLLTNDLYLLP
jgi:hypothetical protein